MFFQLPIGVCLKSVQASTAKNHLETGMLKESPCNITFVVSEGPCSTPATTGKVPAEVRAVLTWPLGRRKEGRVAEWRTSLWESRSQRADIHPS